jgi:hypothetical protein
MHGADADPHTPRQVRGSQCGAKSKGGARKHRRPGNCLKTAPDLGLFLEGMHTLVPVERKWVRENIERWNGELGNDAEAHRGVW